MKTYFPKLNKAIQSARSWLLTSCVAVAAFTGASAFSQVSYTFTPCGATGSVGPTQGQVNSGYSSTNLSGNVTVSGLGIQVWTVAVTGAYRIETRGAQGGTSGGVNPGANGGKGAIMIGDFNLTAGQTLSIVVGQQGSGSNYGGSGGGGTYVVASGNTPLCVAGGGGGAIGYSGYTNGFFDGGPGLTATAGGSANVVGGGTYGVQALGIGGGAPGYGGTQGYGGGSGVASGGGGLLGDGANGGTPTNPTYSGGGKSFVNGSSGGIGAQGVVNSGGFGGGGGTQAASGYGAGGGGYSGGGGGSLLFSPNASGNGGGGGSFNSGANQNNTAGVNTGDGLAIISSLCNVNATASSSVICTGNSTSLTTNAISGYSWSTGNTTSSVIVVSPTITTTYTVSGNGSNPSGCSGNAIVTVTVSPGVPTLAIVNSGTSACLGNTVSISVSGALTYTFAPTFTSGVAFTPPAGNNNYTITGGNGCGTTTSVVTISVSPLPISTSASSALVCASTPVTLTASGATSYTWSPGAGTSNPFVTSPAANTIYTVVGKTGPCSGTATFAVNTKPNPSISVTTNNTVVCEGGSANLTATGNALTYTWNPGFLIGPSITVNPTISTLYSVIGTNSVNCNTTVSQIILVKPNPVVSIAPSATLVCPGDAVTLSAAGGSVYLWSDNTGASVTVVNPAATGTYSVVGTSSNNCSSSASVQISVFNPQISVSSSTAACRGTVVYLSASGMDNYQWSTSSIFSTITVTASPSTAGVYTVTGTSSQDGVTCSSSGTVNLTVNPNPTVTATASSTNICKGEPVVLTGAGATTYTWAGTSPVVSTSISVSPTADQTYSLAGEDGNGCKGVGTIFVKVNACVGIPTNVANTARLTIYPNPSNGDFTISADQTIDLQITNELGQLVKTMSLSKGHATVKVNNLSGGVYFITGKNDNGSVKEKIIIEK